ncbi:MAG: FecR domain-containing protein [Pyrinomonadaceae bacterium]|nr:FecR domain-containing protein [Pyrinomonadaceae bacterium]
MRYARTVSAACSLFVFALLINFAVSEIRASDEDDYDVRARVARVSFVRGDVSLRRAGSKEWERAARNLPLVEGDVLATGRDARLEIQIDRRNFVRVAENSVLCIITLRDEGVALSLSEGTASVRLAKFERDREYFEVDAPNTTLAFEQTGLYRIDAQPGGIVRMTARDGGRARIYSETSGFTLRDGRMAELLSSGEDVGDWQLAHALPFDSWDEWTRDREQHLISRLRDEERNRYYDNDLWGAEELDAYGDWTHTAAYGYVWRPRITVINNYHNWAPYRYGQWRWFPPYGWTWVGDEPWGWAPYHYGRWVYYDNNWCWTPRVSLALARHVWRPALVVFVNINHHSYGNQIAWYPLGYNQRDPRGRHYRRLTPLRRHEIANLERTNPAYLSAVTTLPARDFGTRTITRTRPATEDLARRVVASEPARTDVLPARPRESNDGIGASNRTNNRGGVRPDVLSPNARPARPARNNGSGDVPARELPDRATGAAARNPGEALDNQLRRTRLYNNREPRSSAPNVSAGAPNEGSGNQSAIGVDNTGAVERPARPPRVGRPPRDDDRGNLPSRGGATSNDGGASDNTDAGSSAPEERRERPVRPALPRRQFPRESSPPSGGDDRPDRRERPSVAPEPRPERPPRTEAPPRQESPRVERPREDAPPPREQPAPRRSEPEPPRAEQPAPQQREEREERPARPARAPERTERPQVRDQR